MKLACAYLTWVLMAAVLSVGIVLAVKGSPWLLVLSLAAFIVAFVKYGCIQGH